MPRSRLLRRPAAALLLAAALLGPAPAAPPQDAPVSDTALGMDFYKRGQYDAAAKVLRDAVKKNPADADAWHYLGLARARKEDHDDARKAFERAVALSPRSAPTRVALAYALLILDKNFEAEREAREALTLNPRDSEARYIIGVVRARAGRYSEALAEADEALKLNPAFTAATLLKSQSLLAVYAATYASLSDKYPLPVKPEAGERERVLAARSAELKPLSAALRETAEALEKIVKAEPENEDAKVWRELLESTRCYSGDPRIFSGGQLDAASSSPPSSDAPTSKAVVTHKPEPGFTDRARAACISGVVRLRMVLTADGRVTCIMPVRTLAYGLTERAVRAARRIKFTPARKDGRPVSQWLTVEYSFNCG